MDELSKKLMEGLKTEISPGGWKVTELSSERAANHMQHVQRMAKEAIEARGDYKRPFSTEQSPSTQRLLSMTEDELVAYRNRPLDTSKAQVSAKENAETNANGEARTQSLDSMIAQGIRHSGQVNTLGQPSDDEIGVTPERKGKANEAYMRVKPTLSPFERTMLKTADPEVFRGKVEETKPRPFWQRLLGIKWVPEDQSNDPHITRLRK